MNMVKSSVALVEPDDELSIREIVKMVWVGKWLIAAIVSIAAATSVITALSLPDVYRAEALLAPNEDDGSSTLSSLAAQYGGLASLAGINLGGASGDKVAIGLEILQSQKFLIDFVARHRILVPLIAATSWDRVTDQLAIDPSLYDVEKKMWVRQPNKIGNVTPSNQEAYRAFRQIMSVTQDRRNNLVRVAIEHYSPVLAAQWVEWLIEDINAEMMSQDVGKAEQAIAYLQEQVENTSLAALQNVFFRLIEEQTKTVVLAKGSDEYLLRTIDPAVAPEERARPNRTVIALLGTMFGGFVSLVLVFFLYRDK